MPTEKREETASSPKSDAIGKGQQKAVKQTNCPVCGEPLPPKANFCANCGTPRYVRILYIPGLAEKALRGDTKGPKVLYDDPRGHIDPWQFLLDQKVYVKMVTRARRQGMTVHDLMKDMVPPGKLLENPIELMGSKPILTVDKVLVSKTRSSRITTR